MRKFRLLPCLIVSATALASSAAFAQGDPQAGEKAFNTCKACHTVAQGQPNRVGPNLHGMFGRKAGSAEGFNYSDAMKKADVVWNPETIGKYIQDPKGFIPGNKMAYAGMKDEKQRTDLIAYLEQATK